MYLVPFAYSRLNGRPTLLSRPFERWLDDVAAPRTPTLDLAETEQAYIATVDLPGVEKKDVDVQVEGRRVTLSAGAAQGRDETADGDRVVYRERSQPRYSRSFVLPQELDQAAANAKLENGVLTLTLPKRAAKTAARLTIN